MKRKKELLPGFKDSQYNIIRLVYAIATHPYLPEDKVLLAFDDILKMCKDKNYAKKVNFIKKRSFEHQYTPTLVDTFVWNDSDLGYTFWDTMHEILAGDYNYRKKKRN